MAGTIRYLDGLRWKQLLVGKKDFQELSIPSQIGKDIKLAHRQGEIIDFSMLLSREEVLFRAKITSGFSFRLPPKVFKRLSLQIAEDATVSAYFEKKIFHRKRHLLIQQRSTVARQKDKGVLPIMCAGREAVD